jgi:hypothetical protein
MTEEMVTYRLRRISSVQNRKRQLAKKSVAEIECLPDNPFSLLRLEITSLAFKSDSTAVKHNSRSWRSTNLDDWGQLTDFNLGAQSMETRFRIFSKRFDEEMRH